MRSMKRSAAANNRHRRPTNESKQDIRYKFCLNFVKPFSVQIKSIRNNSNLLGFPHLADVTIQLPSSSIPKFLFHQKLTSVNWNLWLFGFRFLWCWRNATHFFSRFEFHFYFSNSRANFLHFYLVFFFLFQMLNKHFLLLNEKQLLAEDGPKGNVEKDWKQSINWQINLKMNEICKINKHSICI